MSAIAVYSKALLPAVAVAARFRPMESPLAYLQASNGSLLPECWEESPSQTFKWNHKSKAYISIWWEMRTLNISDDYL